MSSPRRHVLASATVLALLTGSAVASAPVTAPAAAASTESVTGARPQRLTLISGDVVTVHRLAAGRTRLEVKAGPGREGMRFVRRQRGGEESVLPADALAPVARGLLDPRLFNVTRLLEDRRDDSTTASVPVIVRYAAGRPGAEARRLVARAEVARGRDLRALDVTVTAVRKSAAGVFWKQAVATRTGAVPLRKIWLDGVSRPVLDHSVARIGAPVAWRSGWTGKGVKVAVLDTGYDLSHPDLSRRVSVSRDFTGGTGVDDSVGHGTHVASTVAGSGAASNGRFKGVAPAADLLVGRVCDVDACHDSAVLAGMEWATQQGARVVNLSLGGPDGPGEDPLEAAVNTLTARTGTLFVVSAGNSGPSARSVESPGSAEAALTVGAVDRQDRIAPFSSRGPRIGNEAIKPDLAAPGVDIVAARAAGTLADKAVDGRYARLSGTSMAAPHVAGAAAILAQQHPDWKADRLKAALVNSVAPAPDGVFDSGSGRVDVARATGQQVTVSPASLGFGLHRWPHTDDKPVSKTLAFRNDGPAVVQLTLGLAVTAPGGVAAPGGMFTVPRTVRVPAAGTAAVKVTVDTSVDGPDGQYTAVLTATSSSGAVRTRTALAVQREVESYDVTLTANDRAGKPVDTFAELVRVGATQDEDSQSVSITGGTETIRVPKGVWNVGTAIADPPSGPDQKATLTLAAHPAQVVDKALTLRFDARAGKAIDVRIPEPSARLGAFSAGLTFGTAAHPTGTIVFGEAGPGVSRTTGVYAVPTSRKKAAEFLYWSTTQWARPNGTGFADSPYQYNVFLPVRGGIPARLARRVWPGELATVVEDHALLAPGNRNAVYPFPAMDAKPAGGFVGYFPFSAGRRVSYYTTGGGAVRWDVTAEQSAPDDTTVLRQDTYDRQYRPGRRHAERWSHPVLGPAFADRAVRPLPYAFRSSDAIRVRIPLLSDDNPSHSGWASAAPGSAELFRDGKSLGRRPDFNPAEFPVPTGAGDYRLVVAAQPGDTLGGRSTDVTAEWTFRSQAPATGQVDVLPLTAVQYLPKLDRQGRAGAGRVRVPLRLSSTTGALGQPVASLTLDVSYDDGRTWSPATVSQRNGSWEASYEHPVKPGGWVTLRSALTEYSGGTAKQTIRRAYQLR